MATREYTKNKLGIDDLESNDSTQIRNAVPTTVRGVNASTLKYSDTKTIKQIIDDLKARIEQLEAL